MSAAREAYTKWIRVTQCENIPLREGRSVRIDTHEIAIFNLGDRFLAIDNRCPHQGGPLSEGIVSGTTVVCPLHAWKIDLQTGNVANRADHMSCVKVYPTRVQEGVIQVELPVEQPVEPDKSVSCMTAPQTNVNSVGGEFCASA